MRLYTRAQVIVIVLATLAVAALVGVGTGLVPFDAKAAAEGPEPGAAAGAPAAGPTPVSPEPAAVAGTARLLQLADTLPGFSQDERENIDVYERLNAGVVNISTETVSLNWFMEPVPREGGTGSGSIIDRAGYVLTNYHVVKNAVKIFVSLADGSRFEGKVVGSDQENDLAVIKFDPPPGMPLTVIPYGDSSILRVGQKVLAIGNPFGLERTLTRGIVSGLGRPVQTDSRTIIREMIQTDASINPGNSGGPLLNSRGELIGVNTMIYSPSGGSVGVGFAVPVDTAKRVVPDLIKFGLVRRGWIDADYVQIFPDLVDFMRDRGTPLPVQKGLLVSNVRKGTNADRAGLRGGSTAVRYSRSVFNIGGDVIVNVDNMPVASIADLYSALEDNKPGDVVPIQYFRGPTLMRGAVTLSDRNDSMANR